MILFYSKIHVFVFSSHPAAGSVCCIMPHDLWPPLSGTNVWGYATKAPPAEWGRSRTCAQQSHQGKRDVTRKLRIVNTDRTELHNTQNEGGFFLFLSPLTRSCDSLRLWWVDLHMHPDRIQQTAAIRQQLIRFPHLHTQTLYYQPTLLTTPNHQITHRPLLVLETPLGSWWTTAMRRNFLPFSKS